MAEDVLGACDVCDVYRLQGLGLVLYKLYRDNEKENRNYYFGFRV